MSWTMDKNGVTPDRPLTETEQSKLNSFMDRIQNHGEHPKTAAEYAGDCNYENLQGKLYSIRLSQNGRATFEVDDDAQTVTFQSVGKHY